MRRSKKLMALLAKVKNEETRSAIKAAINTSEPGKPREIAEVLAAHKTRASYTAVGGVVGEIARNVGKLLGAHDEVAMWVVAKKDQLPSYEIDTIFRLVGGEDGLQAFLETPYLNTEEELQAFLKDQS